MLNEGKVFATIAVKDAQMAKDFYSNTLGLMLKDENPAGLTYESGGCKLFVYTSAYAGTSQATSASWEAMDVDAVVADLKSKGVSFIQFDIPGGTWEGDVAVMGDMRAAWFKDPDGNILAVGNQM